MAAKVPTDYDVGPNTHIISGVLDGVKQSFIDSRVDLEVLSMLKGSCHLIKTFDISKILAP